MFAGMQLAHLPMFVLGLAGMPRRIYTYTAALGWDGWNLVATAGAAILALGVCVVVADLLWHLVRRAAGPHRNPWGAPAWSGGNGTARTGSHLRCTAATRCGIRQRRPASRWPDRRQRTKRCAAVSRWLPARARRSPSMFWRCLQQAGCHC